MSDPADSAFDGRLFARDLSSAPGVYRMYAPDGGVLYVGKAANLKKRVASYFRDDHPSPAQFVSYLRMIGPDSHRDLL